MSEESELFQAVGDVASEVDDHGLRKAGALDSMGHPVQEIESLCMNCHGEGTTRLLLTFIPHFKEIVVMSFECPACGFKNSEIQPASEIQEKGSKYTFKIETKQDFNRQVIKSETGTCKFEGLDLEIPAKRGQLTTVEGLLAEMVDDLACSQEARKDVNEVLYNQIEQFVAKVRATINCEEGTLPVTLTLDDPAGNSWIEYSPGEPTEKWDHTEYARTAEDNLAVGIITREQYEEHRQRDRSAAKNKTTFLSDATDIENFHNEVQTFRATCSSCTRPCDTHMKPVNIPHFKEVIIMSTVCEHCGYKSNEVKTGGAIPDKGRRITLFCDDADDLSRDVLKSETCTINIPELHLDIQQGTLGGRFTTLEGLLRQVYQELESRVFTQTSDSMDEETKQRWQSFFGRLKEALEGNIKFTVIMEDPLAGSYIQNIYAPDPDPNMKIEDYDRTAQQNEDLGLTDMDVNPVS